jgi:DNA replication protein DnaC
MSENYMETFARYCREVAALQGRDPETEDEKASVRRHAILAPIIESVRRCARGAIPLRSATNHFGNFTASETILAAAMRYADEKKTMRAEGINLVMTGGPGVGKTHLAAAVTWELLVRTPRMQVDFWPIVDFADLAKEVYDGEGWAKLYIEDSTRIDWLVIDDLGQERPTDWSRELVFKVVSRRSKAMLPTIYTTNLKPEQIAKRYGDSVPSRIFGDGAVVLKFSKDAKDYRMEKRA